MRLIGHKPTTAIHAPVTVNGQQEVTVLMDGAYHPDALVVRVRAPVWLTLRRDGAGECAERAVFADFGADVTLPTGCDEPVDLLQTPLGTNQSPCGAAQQAMVAGCGPTVREVGVAQQARRRS